MSKIEGSLEIVDRPHARACAAIRRRPLLPLDEDVFRKIGQLGVGNPFAEDISGEPARGIRPLPGPRPLLPEPFVAHCDIFLYRIANRLAGRLGFSLGFIPPLRDKFTSAPAGLVIGKHPSRDMIVGGADRRAMVIAVTDVPAHQPLAACGELTVAKMSARIELAPIHPSL